MLNTSFILKCLVKYGNFFSCHRNKMTWLPWQPGFYRSVTKNEREQIVTSQGNIILDSYHSNHIVRYTKYQGIILANLFISIRTSCCCTICLKCSIISQIAIKYTLRASRWGTLISNIVSLLAQLYRYWYNYTHNIKNYLELLDHSCVKWYFFVTDSHFWDKILTIFIFLFI